MSNSIWKQLIGATGRLLLAYALVFAQGAWASQNQQTKDKTDSPQKAAAQQTGEKQSSAAASAKAQSKQTQAEESESAVAGEKPSRDGSHEGIKVHGHWTIDIRNPDGTLARHVEFENSLDPGFNFNSPAGGPPIPVPGGAAFLSGLLSGQWSAPGSNGGGTSWQILLVGPAGLSNYAIVTSANAPCLAGGLAACIIKPSPPQGASCTPSAGISCNLTVSPQGTAPAFTGLQLSGSVGATQNNGQISTVATFILAPNSTLANTSFTSSSNFPGAPISVSAGQSIAVTVTISFS